MACGWSHTVAVVREQRRTDSRGEVHELANGDVGDRVFSWGAHSQHQLGRSTDSPGSPTAIPQFRADPLLVKCVACGWKHSLLSTACGKVYAWGTGRSGELGLGDAVLVAPRPTLVTSFEHRDDASLKIQRVLCGWQHSVFHATSGEVFTCGSNRHGQLGTPLALAKVNSVPRAVMIGGSEGADLLASYVAVGWHFALCVAASSTSDLVVWGKGSHGQLGALMCVGTPTSLAQRYYTVGLLLTSTLRVRVQDSVTWRPSLLRHQFPFDQRLASAPSHAGASTLWWSRTTASCSVAAGASTATSVRPSVAQSVATSRTVLTPHSL